MPLLRFDQTISIGTILTVLVAAFGLFYSWRKDRLLRSKEYADRVRRAVALVIAKVDRWRELALRLYEDVQPSLTEADGILIKSRDVIGTRDYLWKELVASRTKASQRIVDEQITIAYADLYGYDPRIQELFTEVVSRLKSIDSECYELLLRQTQAAILRFETHPEFESAKLGNALRACASRIAAECAGEMQVYISAFRDEAIKLIRAKDYEIIAKKIAIQEVDACLPPRKCISDGLLIQDVNYNLIHLTACETGTGESSQERFTKGLGTINLTWAKSQGTDLDEDIRVSSLMGRMMPRMMNFNTHGASTLDPASNSQAETEKVNEPEK